ncbi:MAG: choice-of-anchor J domain-containing protein, partial [Muribaculaceae bacterium]|nr:choice-of-anchor J domain-containing protein [Muribaculaceae bacterium]
LGEGTEATVLTPVKNVRGIRTPDRVITIDGFLYEDFESVADGEQRLPDGWKTTSTPGHDSDCWSAGTLGRGDTPLNGVSGYKYAYILGNKETAHDSWLFSPGVSLTAGKEYSIEFFAMMPPVSGSDVMEKLEVFIGSGQTPDAMTLKLEEIENDNDYWRWQGYTFTPETSGTYYMGFHSISPAGSNSTVIDDLKISSGDIPVFKGNTELDMGSTDTRAGLLESDYTFSNDGKAALEVSFEECSDGLQVEGLPLVLDEYQDGTVKITLSRQEAGDYEGHVTLRTNDPTLPTVKIDVTATVKEARVTGYCFRLRAGRAGRLGSLARFGQCIRLRRT